MFSVKTLKEMQSHVEHQIQTIIGDKIDKEIIISNFNKNNFSLKKERKIQNVIELTFFNKYSEPYLIKVILLKDKYLALSMIINNKNVIPFFITNDTKFEKDIKPIISAIPFKIHSHEIYNNRLNGYHEEWQEYQELHKEINYELVMNRFFIESFGKSYERNFYYFNDLQKVSIIKYITKYNNSRMGNTLYFSRLRDVFISYHNPKNIFNESKNKLYYQVIKYLVIGMADKYSFAAEKDRILISKTLKEKEHFLLILMYDVLYQYNNTTEEFLLFFEDLFENIYTYIKLYQEKIIKLAFFKRHKFCDSSIAHYFYMELTTLCRENQTNQESFFKYKTKKDLYLSLTKDKIIKNIQHIGRQQMNSLDNTILPF